MTGASQTAEPACRPLSSRPVASPHQRKKRAAPKSGPWDKQKKKGIAYLWQTLQLVETLFFLWHSLHSLWPTFLKLFSSALAKSLLWHSSHFFS